MFSAREVLDIAIRIEKNGETTYRKAAKAAKNPAVSIALQWMADEEASHGKWFSELKHSLSSEPDNPVMEEMTGSLLEEMLGGGSFALEEHDLPEIDNVREIISVSIELEKDTILFYEILKPFITDEATLNQLETIIVEEEQHIQHLNEMMSEYADSEA